jgi:hypothetical protein
MASAKQHRLHLDLHAQAIHQLSRKLSRIPAYIFPSGRKPTISDIYTANASAIFVPNIPPDLQLPFIFTYYSKLASANFTVSPSLGATPINHALWYWALDQTHSFSRKHRQMRYNILMACIVRSSPELSAHLPTPALAFADALINAWLWNVTHQDDFAAQARFLEIWANGPFDLILFKSKARARMEHAIKQLGQYVPKLGALGGDIGFWEGLKYTSPWKLKTFGPAWAMRWIVEVEQAGRDIEGKGKEAEVDEALETGAFEVCDVRAWSTTQAFWDLVEILISVWSTLGIPILDTFDG